MTAPSNIVNFSQYLPPGVYMNPQPNPQLAVNSTQPTAVGIVGTSLGYQTFVETILINPDTGGTSPSITTTQVGGAGVNDVQVVTVEGSPTGGTFTLEYGGQITSGIAYNAASSAVQSALIALSSIGTSNVTVTGSSGGPYTVTFAGALATSPQELLAENGSGLTGGSSPGVNVTHSVLGIAPENAVQELTINAGAGDYTLGFGGQVTVPLAADATSPTVQAALVALSSIGSGNVTVSGNPGGPYTITFIESLGNQAITLLTSTPGSSLVASPSATLTQLGINTATIIVTNPNTGAAYTYNADYTWIVTGGTNGDSDAQYALERVIGGHINPGDYVQVSYQYTNPTYYTPFVFYDYNDVVAAYGAPFNLSTGTLQSGITLMAKFAFLNGAYQIVCASVQPTGSGGTVATIGDYVNALATLADQGLVAVVVTDNGQQPLHQFVQQHVDQQSSHRFERRGIVGLDGTVSPVTSSQRIIDAQAITDQRIMLVDPATFLYYSDELNTTITLGGQFMSACLAGLTVANSFAMPLTRKTLAGWTGVAEFEQEGQKNMESQNGLCVIEKTTTQVIQVRHGVTTDPANLLVREWSIIGQQDAMVYRLRDYLESANLIGQPIYQTTLINVKGTADAALQSLIRDGLIVDYTGLSCRQLATNPDVLEVSFSWLPAFPLNYIVVTFSVSLTTGNLTTTSGTSNNTANITSTTATNTQVGTPSSSAINDFGGSSNTLQSV